LDLELEKQPPDVRVKKALRDTVGIVVVIDTPMVTPVFACPHQNRVFEGGGAENKREKTDRPFALKSDMRVEPMVAKADAEARREEHDDEERDLKPV
jgi:hypothetical protein